MRIVNVTIYGELKFGGVPQKVFSLSERLSKCGHEVHIVSFHSSMPKGGQRKLHEGVTITYLPWLGKDLLQLPTNIRKLRNAIRRADIVHCYGLYNLLCPLAALLSKINGKPYILEPEGMFVPRARNGLLKKIYNKFCTAWMASLASKLVATSNAEADELRVLADQDKIIVRRNGIVVEQFGSFAEESSNKFRLKYGIGDEERIIISVGRISPLKNLDSLVLAFKQLLSDDLRLILVGPQLEQDYLDDLNKLIASSGLSERIILAGPLYEEEKREALAAASLFVMPSHYESFGIAAAEAVASRVPVLLTEGCGIAPLIHKRAGFAVPATVQDLVIGMETLLDTQKCRALTTQQESVIKELSWDEPLAITERLYASVVQG